MAGVKLNILGYIVKPFESEDLHRRIRQVLKSRGLLPLEGAELYQSVRELALQLQENNTDQALSTVKEILEYKLDEEIAGRMNVVRTSLELGEPELAKPMATRTMQFLAEKGLSAPQGKGRTYNKMELTVRLRYVLNALDKLQPKEAIEKINALLQYNMPAGCQSNCQRALKALQQRNTAEAKKLLRSTLTQISAQD
jgi:HEAT repeat protein